MENTLVSYIITQMHPKVVVLLADVLLSSIFCTYPRRPTWDYYKSDIIIIINNSLYYRVIHKEIYDNILHLTQLWTLNGQGANGTLKTMQGIFPYLILRT